MLIENKLDAVVARPPGIVKEYRCFKVTDVFIAQIIQRLSQRGAPLLIPIRLASSLATAIANPATYVVRTAPRCPFPVWPIVDFNFQRRRMLVEIIAVVRDPKAARGTIQF